MEQANRQILKCKMQYLFGGTDNLLI
ncbi:hypothetical protein EZS27_038138, partial [termite gut metagenome]